MLWSSAPSGLGNPPQSRSSSVTEGKAQLSQSPCSQLPIKFMAPSSSPIRSCSGIWYDLEDTLLSHRSSPSS